MQIRLFNTLTRSIDEFSPADGSNIVRMYSCGPTVYDAAHIGNMRAFLLADLVQRVMRTVGGYGVRWVMNITDVDDKTIAGSALGSSRWLAAMGKQSDDAIENLARFTSHYTKLFVEDLTAFGISSDHFYDQPRATAFISQMYDVIWEIQQAGYAYERDGSVYFDVTSYARDHQYGRLFTIDRENFQEGVRIDADEYDRESVSDFVLWKAQKPGEPAWELQWTDEAGMRHLPGRPGWHLECSAMSRSLLGPLPFDIHTGGVDLRFPHHEDELAQCCAAHYGSDDRATAFTEQSMVWVHNEFLEVEGKKMSKSLNNFFTLRDLAQQGIDPLDVRMAMLGAHYRSVYNFTMDGVRATAAARRRVQDYVWDLIDRAQTSDVRETSADELTVLAPVARALADDLHTPKALAELYTAIGNAPAEKMDASQARQMLVELYTINQVFNVWNFTARKSIDVPQQVRDLAESRWQARAQKNWAESDRLRDELANIGWSVKDGKDGYELKPLEQ
ncbi:MAG: cysteine--tRNA ligase [Bradyrhizobiaceae bacterium]|nr:cysteine--tRNA ligase [Bradyrhizobiaceae bacterium]